MLKSIHVDKLPKPSCQPPPELILHYTATLADASACHDDDGVRQSPDASDSISHLTRAIARGDTRAFGRIYDTYFGYAYNTARRITGRDESFCLDLVQEAMLKLARKVPVLPNQYALRVWLSRVIHRAAIDAIRAEKRLLLREQRGAYRHEAKACISDHQNRCAEAETLQTEVDWLTDQLRQLNATDHHMLLARFIRGRTLAQIGQEVGISGDAAHGRLRRILARLRRAAHINTTSSEIPHDSPSSTRENPS